MNAKITAVLVVLAIAIATTVVAAKPFWSVRTIPLPIQGDPVPGVDVSMEQNPGGKIIGTTQTDSHGIARFANIAPGQYVMKIAAPSKKAKINLNTPKGVYAKPGLAGATIVSGSLDFSDGKPGKATINVSGPGPQTIEVTVKEGPDPRPADTSKSRVKGETDQATRISGVVVTIKKSGATVATATTDAQGIVTFPNLNPGKYDVTSSVPSSRASNNYNSAKSNTAGIVGATLDSGSLTFAPNKPGMASITVTGPGTKTITVTFEEVPPPQKTNPQVRD